jgi:hypothetical protein
MNWLAWDTRSYGGALLGALLGVGLSAWAADAGSFQPWIVGVCIGLGCAVLTTERSTMRGLVLACAAAWAGALAQVVLAPTSPDAGVLAGIAGFHESLSLGDFALHLLGIAGAFLIGRSSFRTGAEERVAGAGRDAAA